MMNRIAVMLAVGGLIASLPAPAQEPSSAADLKATIALHGMPCDQVTDVKRKGDSDYIASCKDGHRYHVSVDAQGRVVVEKQ